MLGQWIIYCYLMLLLPKVETTDLLDTYLSVITSSAVTTSLLNITFWVKTRFHENKPNPDRHAGSR
jgi:hypothetical protein